MKKIDKFNLLDSIGRELQSRMTYADIDLYLKGFGIEGLNDAVTAAGVILHYLGENKQDRLNHINTISRIEKDRYVWIDRYSISNLELLRSSQPDGPSSHRGI